MHNYFFTESRFHKEKHSFLGEKNIALKFRAEESGETQSILKMLDIYSKDVMKEYILQNLLTNDDIFYFKRNLASSLAYQSFINLLFNVGFLKRIRV